MKIAQRNQTARAAFTLIELLVVIAIIAILVGLLSAAVIRAFNKGAEVTARNDITQLSNAVGAFKQKFGVYPPSRLRLGLTPASYNFGTAYDQQLSTDSIQFIQHCFPRFADSWTAAGTGNASYWGWSIPAPGYVDLEGEQVLVFCLGGLQGNNGVNGVIGFSTNPRDPMTGGGGTIGPFYDFNGKVTRLVPLNQVSGQAPTAAGQWFVFLDPWKSPFAYFSSGKRRNGYNAYGPLAGCPNTFLTDCYTLGVWPYLDPNSNFLNADSFQIISAGPDLAFGQGSNPKAAPPVTWTPTTGQLSNSRLDMATQTTPTGLDDLSNFYDKALGISQ
jgi:prepilin-type N-terminal cleavage/methylation domain-containing protein